MSNVIVRLMDGKGICKGDICLLFNISEEYVDLLYRSKTIGSQAINTRAAHILRQCDLLKEATVEEYIDAIIKGRKYFADRFDALFMVATGKKRVRREVYANILGFLPKEFCSRGMFSAYFIDAIKLFDESEYTQEELCKMYYDTEIKIDLAKVAKPKKIDMNYILKERLTPLDELKNMGLPPIFRNGGIYYKYNGKKVAQHDMLYMIRNGEM